MSPSHSFWPIVPASQELTRDHAVRTFCRPDEHTAVILNDSEEPALRAAEGMTIFLRDGSIFFAASQGHRHLSEAPLAGREGGLEVGGFALLEDNRDAQSLEVLFERLAGRRHGMFGEELPNVALQLRRRQRGHPLAHPHD
jgi:hypothetical protein